VKFSRRLNRSSTVLQRNNALAPIISPQAEQESARRIESVAGFKPPAHIHISGICGTGTAAVAILLKELGFRVTGSDKAFYPPMGDVVRGVADRIYSSYSKDNLVERPDLVVIGNALSRDNPEAEYVLAEKIPFASMPEVFAALLIGKRDHCKTSIVVSGTHGKTTTAAAIARMCDSAGRRPGYFVGGVPQDFPSGIRPVSTELPLEKRVVVLEGDEYDSAFFAKWAKFHSYRPDIAIVTSLEFDHADIYESIDEIVEEFNIFVRRVPATGVILVCDEGDRLSALVNGWQSDPSVTARIMRYGANPASEFRLIERTAQIDSADCGGQQLKIQLGNEKVSVDVRLGGPHNALNLLATAAVGSIIGLSSEEICFGLAAFNGVVRRQQLLGDFDGVRLLEDFAHHPTEVRLTLQGFKENHPGRRLIAVFEPRSNTSRRSFFQEDYVSSFDAADLAVIQRVAQPGGYSGTSSPVIALDVDRLAENIESRGTPVKVFDAPGEIEEFVLTEARQGDVVVLMSNGAFGGLPASLTQKLRLRAQG